MNLITKLKYIKLLQSPKYTIIDMQETDTINIFKLYLKHHRFNKEYNILVDMRKDIQSTKQSIHSLGILQ